MPGIWGAVGCANAIPEILRTKFEEPWGACEAAIVGGGIIGGHAFSPYRSVHAQAHGVALALDGQVSAYHPSDGRSGHPRAPAALESGQLILSEDYSGSLALVDAKSHVWFLAADWSGIFPLYYLETGKGLAFCSRQRPIAEVFDLPRDPLGHLEFLRYGYTLAGRTIFRDLRRLLPGQVLRFDPTCKKLELRETSKLWTSEQEGRWSLESAADCCWSALSNAVKTSMPEDLRHAVMISGGWDSRTLLAATAEHISCARLLGYSHGDVASRELLIAHRVCQSLAVPFRAQPIDDAVFEPELLQKGFRRTETVTFPHWHRAGALISDLGFDCVSAGVYGEVLGGHYGVAMLLHGPRKALAVGRMLLGLGAKKARSADPVEAVADLFRVRKSGRTWYLSNDFWRSMGKPLEALNADIERELRRLVARGVVEPDKLVEAFISENRGAQYISAQILSCRAYLNAAAPFAGRDLLMQASQVPVELKIHNKLSQCMMKKHASTLLRFPCAATLLPASMPTLLQEASRLLRHILATGQWKVHLLSEGVFKAPRLSWTNFEFLRSGKSLLAIAEDLRSPIWDRRAIANRVSSLAYRTRAEPSNHVHALANQLMTIYTADLISR